MHAAGDAYLEDAEVVTIHDDGIRVDLYCYSPNQEVEDKRRTTIFSVDQAMGMVILLCRAIEQAEVAGSKRGKKPQQTNLKLKKGKK